MIDPNLRLRSWLHERRLYAGVLAREATVPMVSPLPWLIVSLTLMRYFEGMNDLMYLYSYWAVLVFLAITLFVIFRSVKDRFVKVWESELSFDHPPPNLNTIEKFRFYNLQYWNPLPEYELISDKSSERIAPHIVVSFWNLWWSLVFLIISVFLLYILESLDLITEIVAVIQQIQLSVEPISEIIVPQAPAVTEFILNKFIPPLSLEGAVILTIIYFFPILAIVSTASHLVKISRECHRIYLRWACDDGERFVRSELLHTSIILLFYIFIAL